MHENGKGSLKKAKRKRELLNTVQQMLWCAHTIFVGPRLSYQEGVGQSTPVSAQLPMSARDKALLAVGTPRQT